jgi:hypothetical protein
MLNWLKGSEVDHPLLDAKEANGIADAISACKNPLEALDEASHWLASIKATAGIRRHHRFELISMLDAATRKAQVQLIDVYVADIETRRHQEKSIWNTANEFWGLLADGYLTCATPSHDSRTLPTRFMHLAPLLAVRGIRALRHQMKWLSIRYGALRGEIWRVLTLPPRQWRFILGLQRRLRRATSVCVPGYFGLRCPAPYRRRSRTSPSGLSCISRRNTVLILSKRMAANILLICTARSRPSALCAWRR